MLVALTRLVTGLAATLGVALIALAPRPGQPVAAIFAPATTAAEALAALAAANALLVAAGPRESIVIATGAEIPALYRAGAWLVLDARAAAACLGLFTPRTSSSALGAPP